MEVVKSSYMMDAKEVSEVLGTSTAFAYSVIRKLNKELADNDNTLKEKIKVATPIAAAMGIAGQGIIGAFKFTVMSSIFSGITITLNTARSSLCSNSNTPRNSSFTSGA